MRYEFEWDPSKAGKNLEKHEVAFEEAASVFFDPLAVSRLDDSTVSEERWITVGMSRSARLVLVVHTYVETDHDAATIRMISARLPTKRETRRYETAP